MAHLDSVTFPLDVAQGAVATLERRTDVVRLASGFEEVNQRWANSRRLYSVALANRPADQLAAVLALFEEVRGRANSFRFRDWTDWRSGLPSAPITPTDQAIGTADGAATEFPLFKSYGSVSPWSRRITCPAPASLRVAVGGAEQLSGWSLSASLGVVVFDTPPASGTVTAGFTFDVPVRFEADQLGLQLAHYTEAGGVGLVPDLGLAEVRLA